jgi:hypothetical protein
VELADYKFKGELIHRLGLAPPYKGLDAAPASAQNKTGNATGKRIRDLSPGAGQGGVDLGRTAEESEERTVLRDFGRRGLFLGGKPWPSTSL